MESSKAHAESGTTIRDLYPFLTEGQLKEAEDNLRRYLEHALAMYERIKADPDAYAEFKAALTETDKGPYDEKRQRSKSIKFIRT